MRFNNIFICIHDEGVKMGAVLVDNKAGILADEKSA